VTKVPPLGEDPAMIERLDAGEPSRSPEEAEARASYERLFARLRDLDDIPPSTGWEDRAMARWHATRRRRWVGIAAGATAVAGLTAVLLLKPCSSPTPSGFEIAVLTDPGHPHRGDPAVGNLLRVRAREDRAHVELRVYLGSKLVVRCPGSQACRSDASVVELAWTLVEPGSYQAVVLSSAAEIPSPSDGGLDRDLLEARNARASIEIRSLKVAQ